MTDLMTTAQRFSQRMRERRFEQFRHLVDRLPRPIRILDVGGTNSFWERTQWVEDENIDVTLLNLKTEEQEHFRIQSLVGDARDLSAFDDKSFHVVFSNSVIEHLFTLQNQINMAKEVRRVGVNYWVQTPNFWFPVEPHFQFFGWQWLPPMVRVSILRRKRCGWRGPVRDFAAAWKSVAEVRLMTRKELQDAFPDARIEAERFMGMVKSWIMIGGFEAF